jgi:hypothetical protein
VLSQAVEALTGNNGTVRGAISSGLCAASEIIGVRRAGKNAS